MITLTREEARELLDLLEYFNQFSLPPHGIAIPAEIDNVMEILRAKLSEPEQEPVAWTTDLEFDYDTEIIPAKEKGRLGTSTNDIPLYTAPPQREWVGLSTEELEFYTEELGEGEFGRGVLRAVDDFLMEKNNG